MTGVRYIVDDVDSALEFYCTRLGFTEVMHPGPGFALVERGELQLAMSRPGGGGGGGEAMPDGRVPEPGGWNRIMIEVSDLDRTAAEMRAAGVPLRSDVITGRGIKQVVVDDPAGNPVELFERCGSKRR